MLYRAIERVFVFVLLLSSMSVVDALIRSAHIHGRDPDMISTNVPLPIVIIESAVYSWGTILVLMHWRHVVDAARTMWPLVALALMAPISIAWSDAPILTVRRSAFLLGSTLIGIYLGERFSMEQLARWLAKVLCVLMLGSIILYFIAPASAVDYAAYDGAWQGMTENKNTFGGYMAIAVLVLLLVRFRRCRWLRYVFLLTATILLLLSRSATSLVGCVFIVSLTPLWRLIHAESKTRRVAYLVMVLAICTTIFFIWVHSDPLFRILGRDSTLTGRTDLWLLILSAIKAHPILGYGYGAFWSGMQGEVLNIYIALGWFPKGAHNGYLEHCLNFGILGVPLLLYLLVRSFRMAKDYIRRHEGWLGLWPMSYLLVFVFHNFLESHLLETRSLEFLMFAAITTSLGMELRRTQPRPAHAGAYLFANGRHPVYSSIAR